MKIAIFSGSVPSTTFIENLIIGLANEGIIIYLFGKQYIKTNYPKTVRQFPTPKQNWKLPFFTVKELVFLILKDANKAKFFLNHHSPAQLGWKKFFYRAGKYLPILNHPPDVFHLQWAKMVPDFIQLKSWLNCTILVSLRGAHINYSPIADPQLAQQYKNYFPEVDGFHAVSHAIAVEAEKYGAQKGKIKVIHPAVKEDLLKKKILNQNETYSRNEKLNLISVGRFHWIKGYHYALDALKMVKDAGVNFHYTIIAQGDSEELLYQMHDLNLQDEVKIIPGLPHHEVLQKLNASDLFLLSSVQEGIANVVLEAMAVGVPVLSTNCGGMEEVIEDGVNGWLVPVRDANTMAKKIVSFYGLEQAEIDNVRKAAGNTIEKGFLLNHQVEGMRELYKTLH